jgi:putative hydrolase of the HAD superfamily
VSSSPKSFQALLFDLGGVLYDIDDQRSMDAFKALGLDDFDELYNLREQTDLFDALEIGKIGKKEFESEIGKYFKKKPAEGKIIEAWQALLIGMREENVRLLRSLRPYYRLYLVSNTNEMHLEPIDAEMRENFGVSQLRDLFDKAYFSFEIGLRKPDKSIYEYVIWDAGLDPDRSLFIDDNEDNVKGARMAGLHAFHMKRNSDLREALIKAGVEIPSEVRH